MAVQNIPDLKIVTALLLWLTSSSVSAQYQKSTLELQVEKRVADLRRQQIDTICTYEQYCVGCRGSQVADDSPCATKGILIPTYLFWQQAGRTYRQYLDNCITRAPEEIEADFWAYASRFKQQLQAEEIKDFHIMDDGKPKRVHQSHGGNFSFDFILGQDTISQYSDYFALTKFTRFTHNKSRNIYYQQNRRTHTYKLQQLLSKAAAAKPASTGLVKN